MPVGGKNIRRFVEVCTDRNYLYVSSLAAIYGDKNLTNTEANGPKLVLFLQ